MNTNIIKAVVFGINLLPVFVKSIESLYSSAPGTDKKAAATNLVNASLAGAAVGFGAVGDDDVAKAIAAFAPAVDQSIDSIVDAYNTSGTFKKQ